MALLSDAVITFVVPPPGDSDRAATMTVELKGRSGMRLLTPHEEGRLNALVVDICRAKPLERN